MAAKTRTQDSITTTQANSILLLPIDSDWIKIIMSSQMKVDLSNHKSGWTMLVNQQLILALIKMMYNIPFSTDILNVFLFFLPYSLQDQSQHVSGL